MNVIKRYTNIGGGIQTPSLLVIHAMAEFIKLDESIQVRGKTIKAGIYPAHDWLQELGLSAHFLIEPNGDIIKQRSTKEVCWHAKGYNTDSVGIEVLVSGVHDYASFKEAIKTDWVKPDQFESTIEIANDIVTWFDIDKGNKVVRHSDLSPGRKVDPGSGFKWDEFKSELI
jgi:N-acetyl-anhydromuramyl-L-alanine amidase AmpD